ncbi:MAG: hypothetical protein JW822_08665 [Spirochaetales bacterium]|nr:hypothetical protein [Spirochaetales bacterium]
MGKKLKISFAGVMIISFCHYVLHADPMYDTNDIIIFSTYIGDISSPEPELDTTVKLLRQKVYEVFLGLSGFDVRLMDYYLAYQDLMLFLTQLKEYTADPEAIPAHVEIGDTVISQQDFRHIISSYLLVIPMLTSFTIEEVNKEEMRSKYKVFVSITYTIVNTEKGTILDTIVLESVGYDEEKDRALDDAMEDIPIQLAYEVRSLDIFSLMDRIVEIIDPDVVIKLGKDKGVSVGDEYAILGSDSENITGQQRTAEKGLIIIHDVEKDVSVGRVIYTDKPLSVGTPVKEIGRIGLTIVPYMHIEINFEDSEFSAFGGFKFILTEGFFSIQPVLCFEFGLYPFERLQDELPLRAYGGLDFNLYLGRFQLTGMAAVGTEIVTALSADSRVDGFDFSCLGLAGIATISYLITRDVRLLLDFGYQAWFALNDNYSSYEGWICGAGVGVKF